MTAESLLQRLREECKINRYFATDKLPSTLKEKTAQVQAVQTIIRQPNLSRDDVVKLEGQVREAGARVSDLRDQKLKLEAA